MDPNVGRGVVFFTATMWPDSRFGCLFLGQRHQTGRFFVGGTGVVNTEAGLKQMWNMFSNSEVGHSNYILGSGACNQCRRDIYILFNCNLLLLVLTAGVIPVFLGAPLVQI